MTASQKKITGLLMSLSLMALTIFPRCSMHLTRKAYFSEDMAKKSVDSQDFYQFSEMVAHDEDTADNLSNIARLSKIMQKEMLQTAQLAGDRSLASVDYLSVNNGTLRRINPANKFKPAARKQAKLKNNENRASRKLRVKKTFRRAKRPPVLQFDPLYKKAVALYYRQHYSEAIKILRSLLQFNQRHPLAGQAQHWIGDAYFAMGAYWQAVVEYEKVAMFPRTPKAGEARLMVGIALFRAGKNVLAGDEFMRVLETKERQSVLATAQRYLRKIDRA